MDASSVASFIKGFVTLGVTVLATFAVLLIPFVDRNGDWQATRETLGHIVQRVFPLARGLYEDKVANVWCSVSPMFKLSRFELPLLLRIWYIDRHQYSLPLLARLLIATNGTMLQHTIDSCGIPTSVPAAMAHDAYTTTLPAGVGSLGIRLLLVLVSGAREIDLAAVAACDATGSRVSMDELDAGIDRHVQHVGLAAQGPPCDPLRRAVSRVHYPRPSTVRNDASAARRVVGTLPSQPPSQLAPLFAC